jgi:hypothetical protein
MSFSIHFSLKLGLTITFSALAISACAAKATEPTPFEVEEALIGVINQANSSQAELQRSCDREQGYTNAQPEPVMDFILGVHGNVPPADDLLLNDDTRLIKFHNDGNNLSPAEMDVGLKAVLFETVYVNGHRIPGGCSAWGRQEAKRTTPYFDLSVSVQSALNFQAKREGPALEPANEAWGRCLKGEAFRMVKLRGLHTPSEARFFMANQAMQLLDTSKDPSVIRQNLNVLALVQREVWKQINSCEKKVRYIERFDEIRSRSIATALSKHETTGFINQLKANKKRP